jgi:hypothetical protein
MFKFILVAMTLFAGSAFAADDQASCGATEKYSGTSSLGNGITTFFNPGAYKDGTMTHAFVVGGSLKQICIYLGKTKSVGAKTAPLNLGWNGTIMYIDDQGNWVLDHLKKAEVITAIHCQ